MSPSPPIIGTIFGTTLLCIIMHLYNSPPSAGEATRGYLHGGLAMDFIGQKGPSSKVHLILLDLLVLLVQLVQMSAHLLRASITSDENGGRAKSRAWAGAIQSGANITEVQGTIRVPLMRCEGGAQECSGFAWVGIDGENCPEGSLLQTGIAWFGQNGNVSYKAAFEWLPSPAKYFDIALNPQDFVTVKVTAHNATSGTAYISNLSTGKSASHNFSGELLLCQNTAEWILEDFTVKSADGTPELDNFARFNDIAFSNASYVHYGGISGDFQGATMVDMVQGMQGETLLVGCEIMGPDAVHCQYAPGVQA
ncbi:uncharacterized protein MYCFIDRAFT_90088 [Pseudocercospora fijiensis CIRAD86]|uniref:DUF1746 domain-containing protein n=1 Tax=Pseudocercospora fijiensis (strain CIRAD86) TaxID=383855 RepID=M3A3F6_PSEFD|nr:uncharacterized protein MYCFIDRAFT_90088 [Pseudocercospora fijiensis CIRAD86]EME79171.1 hypothetical protein MYCFIDRAFT_90088 [Pseudocercospora fijiensis CIRAD86]